MHSIRDNGITLSKVIVALNVGCDDDGTYYVSDEKRQGVHWALLVIDLKMVQHIMVIHSAGLCQAIWQVRLDQT